ncbi:MAG: zinc metallopeptidase [Firmicutes bacterium]|nr:zinc metallopeptidase [Bacillota bacterium]
MYGYGGYGGYSPGLLFLLPAILITLYAQTRVRSAYTKYAQVANSLRITGAQVAETIIRRNGLGINIQAVQGSLTDNYNPQTGILSLSSAVYSQPSIASIAIAAHECGHAMQHAEGYALLNLRNNLVPVTNIASSLSWPILILGLMAGNGGDFLFNIGVTLFMVVVLFHLVTLPVELDASKRAMVMLQDYGLISSDQSEISAAREVLNAAALTYVGSLVMSIANLLRILSLRGGNRR